MTLKPDEKNRKRRGFSVIDCDIHNTLSSETVLYPYLSERWRRHHQMLGAPDRVGGYVPRGMPYGARYDAWTPSGHRPGSDLNFLREHRCSCSSKPHSRTKIDSWDIEYGILNSVDCDCPPVLYVPLRRWRRNLEYVPRGMLRVTTPSGHRPLSSCSIRGTDTDEL